MPFPERTVFALAAGACALFPFGHALSEDLGTVPVRDWGQRIHQGCGQSGPGFASCTKGTGHEGMAGKQ